MPFPAGGPTDIVARPFAQMLGEALKAIIVVDNRGGAGGSIGADVVAKSAPDGQSILVGTVGTHAINSALYAKLPYDALQGFHPACDDRAGAGRDRGASLASGQDARRPRGSREAKSGQAQLRHRPASVRPAISPRRCSAPPPASTSSMCHIKAARPRSTDLIGGQIQIMFDPLQSVLSNVQGGKIRALALSSKTRSAIVPDVPTIAESGYAGFETTAWWGVFAPAKMPEALTAALVAEIERIAASDGFRGKLEPLGVTAVTNLGGAAFADFQKSEIAKWGKAVQDADVKID